MPALRAVRSAQEPAATGSAPASKSQGASAGTPLFLQRAVDTDRPRSSTEPAVPALQRQPSEDEETTMNETAAVVPEAPIEATEAEPATETTEPAQEQKGDICCDPEEFTPPWSRPFNINDIEQFETICAPTGCVSVTISSKWASPHEEKHFRVRMIVFEGPKKGVIARRFDVGRETQFFRNLGKCTTFKLQIEVFSKNTSPNLKGTVSVASC